MTKSPKLSALTEQKNQVVRDTYFKIVTLLTEHSKTLFNHFLKVRIEIDHSQNPDEQSLIHEFLTSYIMLILYKGEDQNLHMIYGRSDDAFDYLGNKSYSQLLRKIYLLTMNDQTPIHIEDNLEESIYSMIHYEKMIEQTINGELTYSKIFEG